MVTVIIFIVILSLLVFVHELGHFWTAKKMGMKVEEFGFGFPPKAWSTKRGETEYSINWLPIGGFVRIKGEDGENRDDPDSFAAKKPWQKFLVLAAGVIMNFLLAGILLSIGFMVGLPQAVDGVDPAQVSNRQVQIVNVLEGSPAAEAGVQLGDAVTGVNQTEIESVEQLIAYADEHVGETVTFSFLRGEEVVTKEIEIITLESTGKGGIGIGLLETGVVRYGLFQAIYQGFETTVVMTGVIVEGFYNIIKNLIVGRGPGIEVSGPVGIAVMTGQIAQLGLSYLLQFTAILSINLAVLNFLPFPALDGGRIVFVAIEKLRGRPVSQKIEGMFHATGMALLLLLIVIVTFQDVLRIFK